MGVLFLIGGIAAICFLLVWLFGEMDQEGLQVLCGVCGALVLIIGLFFLGIALYAPIQFQEWESNYEARKTSIEVILRGELSEAERVALAPKILEMIEEYNRAIMKHRTFHDNIWIGVYYSETIAELELLSIPGR